MLLIRHDEDGALGVVLNRPADKTLKELWESVSETPCHREERVNLGGPVPGPLMAIHTQPALADIEVLPGRVLRHGQGQAGVAGRREGDRLRVFVGHAGWGGGQLEGELEQGAWLTTPAAADHVFYDDTDLWETVTKSIGTSTLQSMLKIKEVPGDPSVN